MIGFGTAYRIPAPFDALTKHAPPAVGVAMGIDSQIPYENGGTGMTATRFNQIMQWATMASYAASVGFPMTWDSNIVNLIHGYPKGARLLYRNGENPAVTTEGDPTELWEVVSKKDNNEDKPKDGLDSDWWEVVGHWKNYSFAPDFSKQTIIYANSFAPGDAAKKAISVSGRRWIYLTRTFEKWEVSESVLSSLMSGPKVCLKIPSDVDAYRNPGAGDYTIYKSVDFESSIPAFAGQESAILMPCGGLESVILDVAYPANDSVAAAVGSVNVVITAVECI